MFRGYNSERLQRKMGLPMNGVPPYLQDFKNYISYLEIFLGQASSDTIQNVSPGYYYLRLPRIELGTIELCACDTSPDLQLTLALFDLYTRVCKKIVEI